ncbi:MAG: FkbM family methyltransferase, partial [Terriglobales bacterium]
AVAGDWQEPHLQTPAQRAKRMLKGWVGELITSDAVGNTIGLLTGNHFRSRGLRVDTSHPAIKPEIKATLFWDVYESAEIRFVRRYLRKDIDVVELGASLGIMVCQIRDHVDAERKVVCVEASPQLAPVIRRNLELNGFAENTPVITAAIDYSGTKTVSFWEGGNNLQGFKDEKGTTVVPALTLEQLLADHQIGDYALVCDIEGAEAGIIFQGRKSLDRCQQIVFELHDTVLDGRKIFVDEMIEELVKGHGFRYVDRYGTACVFDRNLSA